MRLVLGLGVLTALQQPDRLASQSSPATYVLVVSGLSGEPQFAAAFRRAARHVLDAARAKWGVPDSNTVYLAEEAGRDSSGTWGKATRDGLKAALESLARRTAAGDLVFVLLLGHGSGQGAESRLSLPGPDVSAADFSIWLGGLVGRTTVLVNAATASGDFVAALKAKDRIVVTATKSAFERNESVFAEHFTRGIAGEADADKDDRVSVLEAFQYARREVARHYESKRLMQTEHPQLSDSAQAQTVAFGVTALPADPRIAALVAERRALEAQIDALRRRKGTLDSLAYERELERLLLEIAAKTAAIRAAGGGRP